MDPIATARYGMMAAAQRLKASAGRIAAPDADLASEAVEMIGARHAFKAQVRVVQIADEMWRSLLDLQAAPARA